MSSESRPAKTQNYGLCGRLVCIELTTNLLSARGEDLVLARVIILPHAALNNRIDRIFPQSYKAMSACGRKRTLYNFRGSAVT
jgi:hypothetical protein